WTKWMRNDQDHFFEKKIPIGSLRTTKVAESNNAKTFIGKPDLQFFAEGGTFVAGIKSRIAFKAIGQDGLGINVKGIVFDNDNKQVTTLASAHLGMGSFELLPETGKTYHAELILTNGTKQDFALPQAEEKGITLSIDNDSIPLAKVTIKATDVYFKENNGKNYTLLIYSGGIATMVDCVLDSTVITLNVLKRRLFTGISRVTLFSPQNEPLCERLIFIQNFDELTLNVASDKPVYSARDKVSMQLNARTRADSASAGHFSVSVTDEGKIPENENSETTILSDLLLTSDLKGYVEQPNYYFTSQVIDKLKELDLVMLTHGYCRFEWKQVLRPDNKTPIIYGPEHSISINGTAESLFGKPLPNAKVSLISVDSRQFITDTADDKGHFKFDGMYFTDTARYVLQAVNAKGGNKTKLIYSPDKPPVADILSPGSQSMNADTTMHAYLDNDKKVEEQHAKLNFGKVRMLAEVKINDYHSSNIMGPGHADQVLHEKDFENFGGMLSNKLNGLLHGINILNGVPYIGNLPMNIYLDYSPIKNLDQVNPNDIETVEVLKFATAGIYGVNGGAGVVILTSKAGSSTKPGDIASIGVLPIAV
ncbi:MAG TPA: TonB-dependent receptor, partial [Mucilaginibacter sp.]|nr:TonB-dependent receptor [Mucilaginibacter sp.]